MGFSVIRWWHKQADQVRRLPIKLARWADPLREVPPAVRTAIADPEALARDLAGREWPPIPEAPEVSVVIPVFNHRAFTLGCLRSILETRERTSFEILVVDDGSSDGTETLLPTLPGIRYLRNAENLGFVGSCNRGAAEARGDFLYFLNNDTAVLPGWLDRLRDAFRDDDRLGLAGARLVYPDGRLQECGGLVFRDGGATRYGGRDDPAEPGFNYRRETDYCSGAAILLPAPLFREIGGFAARYAPAYYEDTDLAFAVRQRGLRVACCPQATVVHWDGVTAGRDTRRGVKANQVRNAVRFRDRWRRVLERHAASLEDPRFVLERQRPLSALVVDTSTPRPDCDSGSIDMVNLLALLRDYGYHVVFAPRDLRFAGEYTRALQARGVECIYRPRPWSTKLGRSIKGLLRRRGREFSLVVLTRPKAGSRFLDAVRAHCPRARVVYNTVDLHYLRYLREAEVTGSRTSRSLAEDYRRQEHDIMRRADVSLLLNADEAARVREQLPGAATALLPLLREVPDRAVPGPSGRSGMLFVGGFGHHPNRDAMRFFLGDVLPRIRAGAPELVLHVVGGDLPQDLRDAAGEGVVVHGRVRDLAPLYDAARMTVAPLRYGAGMKGKVLESLIHGVPCVTTPVGAEGFGAEDGRELMVTEGAEAFAQAVLRLHREDDLWNRLSASGLALARSEFGLERSGHRLAAILASAGVEPFAGTCPLCGHTGPMRLEPGRGLTPRCLCDRCGAEPWMRTLAAEVPRDGVALALDLPAQLRPLRGGAWVETERVERGPEGPFAAIVTGADRLEGAELDAIARRLAPEGRLLWAPRYDPRVRRDSAPAADGAQGRELMDLLHAHGLDGEALCGPGPAGARVAWSCWRAASDGDGGTV